MDGSCPAGERHVFRLYLHGYTLASTRIVTEHERLVARCLRPLRRFRNFSERICILPDFCRYHTRQDGCAFHGHTLGCRHAGRCLDQLLRREQCLHRQWGRGLYEPLYEPAAGVVERHPVLRRDARLGQNVGHRLHVLRMRCRDGRYHRFARYRQMVQG